MISSKSIPAAEPAAAGPTSSTSSVGRVLRGTAALSVVAVINTISQLAIVPVALHFWGAGKYGDWVGLSALVAFLGLSDIGIQTYVVNRMSARYARGESEALTFDLHSALRLQLPLVVALWCFIALGAWWLPFGKWLAISSLSRPGLAVTVMALACEVVLSVPMGVVVGTYRASGKLARAGYITAVQRAVLFLVSAALIALGADLPAVAVSRLMIQVATWTFVVLDLKRLFAWMKFWPIGGSFRVGAQMLGPGLLFLLAALADYVASQGTIALVQSRLGGAELAHYATHRTFVNIGRMVSGILATAVWPELTAMDARGERAGLIQAHRSYCKLNGWIVGALLLALIPVSDTIYSAWTLRTLNLDKGTLIILAGQSVLWAFWTCGVTVLAATNRQGKLVAILLINAVAGTIIAYVLLPRFGIRGAALGGLLGDLLVAVWLLPATVCHVLGDRFQSFIVDVAPIAILGLVVPFGLVAIAAQFLPWVGARGPVVSCTGFVASLLVTWYQLKLSERQIGQRIIDRVHQGIRSKLAAATLGGNT